MLGYRSSFSVEVDSQLGLDREKAVDALLGEGFAWMRSQKGNHFMRKDFPEAIGQFISVAERVQELTTPN